VRAASLGLESRACRSSMGSASTACHG